MTLGPSHTSFRVKMVRRNTGTWTHEEHSAFLRGVQMWEGNWEDVASLAPTRSVIQTRTHSQKSTKESDLPTRFLRR